MVKTEKQFIDLEDKRRVVLTENDVAFVRDNPHGLTKEGCKAYKNDWVNHSRNRYMKARYTAMRQKCKTFTRSGKLKDGRIILSRDKEGNPKESSWLDTDYNRYSRKEWNELPEVKRLTDV